MAIERSFRAALRWWPVMVVGLLVTFTVAGLVYIHPGVYYAQSVILLSRPSSAQDSPLVEGPGSVVMTASVIQRTIAGPNHLRTVSSDVRLVDTGVRDGWSLTLWNSGGQWNNYFDRPQLTVEVAGPTASGVRQRNTELVDEVSVLLDHLQAADSVPVGSRITEHVISSNGEPYLARGRPKEAAAMTLLLGGFLSLATVNLLEARRRRRIATALLDEPVSVRTLETVST